MKSFSASLKSVLISNYATFSARAPRAEYWFYTLFVLLVSIALGFVDLIIDPSLVEETDPLKSIGVASGIFSLVTLIPGMAVSVRRLHDVGRSGWWLLLILTIIGLIPLFYWTVKRGDKGENRFGADPYGETAVVP